MICITKVSFELRPFPFPESSLETGEIILVSTSFPFPESSPETGEIIFASPETGENICAVWNCYYMDFGKCPSRVRRRLLPDLYAREILTQG